MHRHPLISTGCLFTALLPPPAKLQDTTLLRVILTADARRGACILAGQSYRNPAAARRSIRHPGGGFQTPLPGPHATPSHASATATCRTNEESRTKCARERPKTLTILDHVP